MNLRLLRLSLKSLSAYQSLEAEPVMEELFRLLEHMDSLKEAPEDPWLLDATINQYSAVFFQLRQGKHQGFGDFFWDYLRYTPTLYGTLVMEGSDDVALSKTAQREIQTLMTLSILDCETLLQDMAQSVTPEELEILNSLPRWSNHCPFDFDTLTQFYQQNGCGTFAKHRHFVWRGDQLHPVTQVQALPPHHMKGYEIQRNQVMNNTQLLASGQKAQNVLLFGNGGTGKSEVIKSMMWVEEFTHLRLIQAENNSLATLPELIARLPKSPYQFIIFIDDLAFDQDDMTYSILKSVLEGGLDAPPAHVAVYATSNRRHLVRQTFADRAGDEVDMTETIAEKTALSDRFGLRISYLSMTKPEYLDLVSFLYELEKEKGGYPTFEKTDLHIKAMMWEIRNGGRTPRVANQFICSLREV